METSKRIFNNTIFLYGAEMGALLFAFLLSTVIAHTLGSAEFGKLAFVNSIIVIAAIFTDPGISYYLIKQGSQQQNQVPRLSGISLATRFFFSILTCIVVILYSYFSIKDPISRLMTILISFTFVLNVIPSTVSALLRIQERMRIEATISIITKILFSIFGVVFIVRGFGIQSIAWITLATAVVTLFLFLFAWKKTSQPRPSFPGQTTEYISFLRNAVPFAILIILTTIYFRIDTVMIEYMLGSNDVGHYAAAYRLMEGLLMIPLIFSGVIFPVIAKNIKTNIDQVRTSVHHVLKLHLILAVPLATGIILFSSRIIPLFFGHEFGPSILVLQLLAPTVIAVFVTTITSTIIISGTRPMVNSYIATGMVIVNVALNLVLIPRIGIAGAALATFITELFGLIVGTIYINNSILKLRYVRFFIKPILASAVMGTCILLFPSLWAIPLFIGIYCGVIYLIKGIDGEDVRLIKSLIQRNSTSKLPVS